MRATARDVSRRGAEAQRVSDPPAPEAGTGPSIEAVTLLIREGEGLTVEFKERYTSRIDEDIVAFANGRGGTLLLGVRDDGTVAGEKLTNDLKGRINSLARNCKPGIDVEASQVGEVVAVEVPEGTHKPYSCGSGYFRRLNGSTQKMSHDELGAMFVQNEPVPFEERPARDLTFEGVSPAKVRAFCKEAGIRIGRTSVPDFLRSLKVAGETQVTNAGALFFAKDLYAHIHQAQMTLVAFKGVEKLHIYDRRDVRDDLLTQFNEAEQFLGKHLNLRSEISGFDRKDIYEIPLEVMREAVVNALMHRDYSITGTQVSVEIYDDRVEVINPGGLPAGLSVERLGQVSVRRNEIVADLFFRIHKVERMGMGIRKMKKAMAAAGLKAPEFEPNGFFRAVFYRASKFALKGTSQDPEKTTQKTTQKATQKATQKIAPGAARILELIRQNPGIGRKELSALVGMTEDGIKYHLQAMKQAGTLRRVGPDRGGHWEVLPASPVQAQPDGGNPDAS